METLNLITEQQIQQYTKKSPGSIKLGQTVRIVGQNENLEQELRNSMTKYVILGVQEDIGNRAKNNHISSVGSFDSFVKQFVNFQDNLYFDGDDCLLLGSINLEELNTESRSLTISENELSALVERVDEKVQKILSLIFESGKIPIIIGGGQNNSYPILKALAKVENKQVNCLNIAAHTSLKPPDRRHSRNGFSFALVENILNRYYIFGIHESEIPHSIYEFILANYGQIGFTRFEAILKNDPYLFEALNEAKDFLQQFPVGLEINMNCISDIALSPQYPDGFLLREVRQIIKKFCEHNTVRYLHLCEASSNQTDEKLNQITGKSLALLAIDFMKALNYGEEEEE